MQIITGDVLEVIKELPDCCCSTCVTSPPYYGLRNYGTYGQIGLEETPDKYIERLVEVFREVRRVLKDDGTLWLNMGDSYAGSNGNGTRQTKWRTADVYKSEKIIISGKQRGEKTTGASPKT